jgi:pimeloyl-ACP methyl ester carboxylesterase
MCVWPALLFIIFTCLQALAEQRGAVLKFFEDPSVLNKLSTVTNRLLILHGVQDQIIPIRNAGLANNKILGSWTMEFPGEGHGIPFSHPMAVIRWES